MAQCENCLRIDLPTEEVVVTGPATEGARKILTLCVVPDDQISVRRGIGCGPALRAGMLWLVGHCNEKRRPEPGAPFPEVVQPPPVDDRLPQAPDPCPGCGAVWTPSSGGQRMAHKPGCSTVAEHLEHLEHLEDAGQAKADFAGRIRDLLGDSGTSHPEGRLLYDILTWLEHR